jgi:hypothetical protein
MEVHTAAPGVAPAAALAASVASTGARIEVPGQVEGALLERRPGVPGDLVLKVALGWLTLLLL